MLPILNDKVIILSDTNLNSLYQQQDKYDTAGLKNVWVNFMDQNNLLVHNDDPTHFKPNTVPSCIDHVWSNCSNRISNIQTCAHFLSYDHNLVKANVRVKIQNCGPAYSKYRNWKLVTKEKLQLGIALNPNLAEIFQITDAEIVAETIQNELNLILNDIAPPLHQTK